MKIFEFMAVGVPLVVSRTKIHQYYYDDSLVKYYENDDQDQLAANVLLLRKDVIARDRQVSNALKYVEANNWDVEKNRYLSIVDSLAGKRHSAAPRKIVRPEGGLRVEKEHQVNACKYQ